METSFLFSSSSFLYRWPRWRPGMEIPQSVPCFLAPSTLFLQSTTCPASSRFSSLDKHDDRQTDFSETPNVWGGQPNPSDWHILSTPLSPGVQPNSWTWNQPVYAPHPRNNPNNFLLMDISPHHLPHHGLFIEHILPSTLIALLIHLLEYYLIFTQCHGTTIISPFFIWRYWNRKVKCFEFHYSEFIISGCGWIQTHLCGPENHAHNHPTSHWTEMI